MKKQIQGFPVALPERGRSRPPLLRPVRLTSFCLALCFLSPSNASGQTLELEEEKRAVLPDSLVPFGISFTREGRWILWSPNSAGLVFGEGSAWHGWGEGELFGVVHAASVDEGRLIQFRPCFQRIWMQPNGALLRETRPIIPPW